MTWRATASAFAIALGLAAMESSPAVAAETRLARSKVPSAVLAAVSARHPRSKMTDFAQEHEGGKTVYEVTLETGSGRLEVIVSPAGKILTEEQTIAMKDLPDPVRKSLARSRHAKAKVLRLEKVTDHRKPKEPTYELLVELLGKKHELVFSSAGRLLKEEAKSKGDED